MNKLMSLKLVKSLKYHVLEFAIVDIQIID